jgi:hypothetical protein
MKISDLHKMESIVSGNPSLSWEGWNVVFLEKDQDASLIGTRKLCSKILVGSGTFQTLY